MSFRMPRCGCLVVVGRGCCRGFCCGRGGSGGVGLSDGRGWKKMSVVFHQVETHWVGKLGFSVRLRAGIRGCAGFKVREASAAAKRGGMEGKTEDSKEGGIMLWLS